MAKMMQPMMREMMNRLMKVTPDHDNDPTYKEVQDFMVPKSSGHPFVDAPGAEAHAVSAHTQHQRSASTLHSRHLRQRNGLG